MAYGGLKKKMDAAAEIERNPVSKPTTFSLNMEMNRLTRDGTDCRRPRLARPNSQARTGTGKSSFSLFQLTTSRIGNLTG